MDVKDLKVGDKVYIRGDLKDRASYGRIVYFDAMKSGVMIVNNVFDFGGFPVFTVDGTSHGFIYSYEMVDWEKTSKLNKKYVKNIKPTYNGTVLSWDDIEVTRHRDDKEDLEKAVMMLLLKKEGYSFGDVRRIVKNTKVKWVPKDGQEFFFITSTGNISSDVYYGAWSVHEECYMFGNCFRTEEEAEEKLEQIRKLLQEER